MFHDAFWCTYDQIFEYWNTYYFIKITFLLFLQYITVQMLHWLFKLSERVGCVMYEFNFRMINELLKRFEWQRGLWVPSCWEPPVWSVSLTRRSAPWRQGLVWLSPRSSPQHPGECSAKISWIKEWWRDFRHCKKNWSGGDIYGQSLTFDKLIK